MRVLEDISEHDMVALFLQAEVVSQRFGLTQWGTSADMSLWALTDSALLSDGYSEQ